MKNIILLIIFTLSFTVNSQVSSMSYSKNKEETSSFYNESAIMRTVLTKESLYIYLDLDGNDSKYFPIYCNYLFLEMPNLIYNENTLNYTILINLIENGDSPMKAIIEQSSNSILLLFGDGSSLLYIGEGITIII